MDISIRKQFCSGSKVVLFLAVTLFFSTARAQFPMFPPAPYEIYPPTAPEFIVGGYTVDWQDTSGSICWLSERVNNGSWAAVPNTYSPTKTITLSRSVGNYDYQVACIDDYGGVLGPISSVGVVSSMPTLDPLDVQLGYSFQVRTGHFNGDGKKDVYIKRTGGHADNGVIYKTILTQNNDGNFDVVENPTSGQLSNAAGWPVSSGVDAVVNDFNVDGRVDVMLKNLDSVISGIDDQIVYSIGKFFKGNAQAATSIDFEFEKFFRDTYNWILDPNYFSQAISPSLPAYNFSLDINVYFCSYWYGFPTCLNVGHALFNQTVTLSMLGLSGYETIAEAEQGLADALGFASYDTFECALVCGWIEFYGFYSSTVFTFYDVWSPTTESPGFDDINFSKYASDAESSLAEIINADVVNAPYSVIDEFSGYLSDRLGIEIQIGTEAANCEDAPFSSNFAVGIPVLIEGCQVVLAGIINTIGIILIDAAFDHIQQPPEPIFRVYGGSAGKEGRFWTPQFPLAIPDYRNAAGLPQSNDCSKIVFGSVSDKSGVVERLAQPILNSPPGYSVTGGGVTEYEFTGGSHFIFSGKIQYGPSINFSPPC